MIYSYYLCDIKRNKVFREKLIEHIESGLKYLKNIIGNNKRICNIIKDCLIEGGYDLNLGLKTIFYVIKSSIVLHDIGKIFYQRNLKRKNDMEYLSFRGHEILSGLVTSYVLNDIIDMWVSNVDIYRPYKFNKFIDELIKTPLLFSIIYHHHAMNIEDRYRSLVDKEADSIIERRIDIDEYKLDIIDVISMMPNDIRISEESMLNSLKKVYKILYDKTQLNMSIKKLLSYVNYHFDSCRRLCLLIISILITVDYLSSSSNRDMSKGAFRDAVNEYYHMLTHTSPHRIIKN